MKRVAERRESSVASDARISRNGTGSRRGGGTPPRSPLRQSTEEHRRHSQPSCGRATGSSDLAVLLCSQRNERQAGAELSMTSSTVSGRSMGTAGPGRSIRSARVDAVETV
jgi:hypothetical protein